MSLGTRRPWKRKEVGCTVQVALDPVQKKTTRPKDGQTITRQRKEGGMAPKEAALASWEGGCDPEEPIH